MEINIHKYFQVYKYVHISIYEYVHMYKYMYIYIYIYIYLYNRDHFCSGKTIRFFDQKIQLYVHTYIHI
jgi:hypothetical protein